MRELGAGTLKFLAVDEPSLVWRMLGFTVALAVATFAAILACPAWYWALPLSVLLAFLQVRSFAFFHDYLHGAVLRGARGAEVCLSLLGVWLLVVPSVWRETHNYHHAHNCKLVGSSIGSYPLASTNMWPTMSRWQRLKYRALRHPLTILMGYLTIFGYGLNLAPFLRNPRRHWAAPVALLVHVAQIIAVGRLFGVSKALLAVVVPLALAHAIGAYLFYVQHNFVGMRLRPRDDWDYVRAALEASSMFEMSPLMHWLTGNIGFHHVHHLNHRVPFYKLPQAMQRVPELQRPQTTSWRWHDVAGCLSLMLWDNAQQRMLTRGELARSPRGA